MRFLYIKARSSVDDLPMTLESMGHEVERFTEYDFDPNNEDPQAAEALEMRIKRGGIDYLISYLFFEEPSDICERVGLKYISWVYDSPLISLFSKSAQNDVNRIFVFDRSEYDRLKDMGASHVFYMPMAACTARIGRISLSGADEARFSSDISFVGDLYADNAYDRIIGLLDKEKSDEIKDKLQRDLCNWRNKRPWPVLDESVVGFLQDKGFFSTRHAHGLESGVFLGVAVISRKLAQMERVTVLNSLAAAGCNVDLYTRGEGRYLEGVSVHPGVDYYTDMTKVFNLSRINLNITIPSIETGLPQRVWDIMGSGGFCMTNHQEEVSDFFEIGKDLETFGSIEELIAKAGFYLKHEDLRLNILLSGYRKVMEHHTYEHRLERMLELAGN